MADTTAIDKTTPKLPTLAAAGRSLGTEIASHMNSATIGTLLGETSGLMSVMPNMDPVLRKANIHESALNDLASDPHIFSLIQIRKAGVLSKEWDIDRGKAKSRFAEMLRALFRTYNMPNLISQILDAELYGNQPIEVTWQSSGNSWLPVELEAKPREWFSMAWDGTLRFHTKDHPVDGIIVRRFRGTDKPGDLKYKFLCPRNSPSYLNPYGEAVLSRCYWNQFFKKEGKKFWAQFIENFGSPWVSGEYIQEYSDKPEKVDEFLQTLQMMAGGRTIAVPEGTKVQFHSPPAGVSDTFEKFLDDARAEIAWAILGHSSMQKSTAGKLGNDTTELTVAEWIMSSGKQMVEQTMNELIDWIAEVNGIQGERPRFILYEEEQVDLVTADRDTKLYSVGWRPTAEYIQRTYGMDETDFTLSLQPAAPATPATFAANPDQEAQAVLDKYIETLLADSKANDAAVNAMFSVVSDYINSKSSFKEAISGLSGVFGNMDESKLETILFALIGSARMTGFSAAAEDGQ